MKIHEFISNRLAARATAIITAAMLGFSTRAFAQTSYTWNGNGSDNNFGTSANWVGGNAPNNLQGYLNFSGSTRPTPNNNYSDYTGGYQIYLNAGATVPFTITGNHIKFYNFGGGGGDFPGQPNIENDSSSKLTVNFGFGSESSGVNMNITASSGNIDLGASSGNAFSYFDDVGDFFAVHAENGHTVTIWGAIGNGSQTAKFSLDSGGICIFNAANSYTGESDINAGELQIGANGGISSSSAIYLGNGGSNNLAQLTLTGNGGQTFSDNVNVNTLQNSGSDHTRRILAGGNTSGNNTYSGTITLSSDISMDAENSGGGLTFSGQVHASSAFTGYTTGPGTVTLSGTVDNSFLQATVNSGTLVLDKSSGTSVHALGGVTETVNNGGTLQLANNGGDQIQDGANVVVNSGGTFDLGGASETINSITFSGVGVNGTGAITNSSSSLANLNLNAASTLAGNASIGGDGDILVTGGGALFANSISFLTNLGPDTLELTNGSGLDDLNFHIVAAGGTVVLAKFNTSQSPSVHAAGQVTILSGATIQLGGSGGYEIYDGQNSTNLSGGVLDLNGQNQTFTVNGSLHLNGTGIGSGGALINSSSTASTIGGTNVTGVLFLDTSSSFGGDGNLNVAGVIAGGGGLSKVGGGILTLVSNNTYSGSTTISTGTLALTGTGSIAGSTGLSIAAGATFDTSAQPSFTLGGSQSISASGTGTIAGTTAAAINGNGTVSLGSQPINLTFTPASFTGDTAHPALYISTGTLSLNGNSFTVTNAGGTALGVGTYRIIQQAGGNVSSSGTYSVNVTGAGIAGGTTASIQVSGANVNLLVKETPAFSNLTSSQSITAGASSITLGGKLSGAGPVYPASGETITVTIDGNAQNTIITDSTGDFSINYNPSTIPASGTPYPITYSYTGDASLNATNDVSTALTVKSVASFSNLTPSQSVIAGSSSIALSGKLSADGPVYPANGETVTVTINGNAQNTSINDSTGDFSINYNPSSIPASVTPHPIIYSYPGDGSLGTASDSSTSLTVEPSYSAYRITDANNGSAMAGSGDTLTISAVNSDGTTNSVVSGSITLTFGGLASSPGGAAPTYGGQPATVTLIFSGGQAMTTLLAYDATNGAMVTVTDGTHTTSSSSGSPLTLTAAAAIDNAYRISAATTTPTVAVGDALTINIVDQYQNPSTFTGNKTLNFGGLSAGPDGSLPTVTDKNGMAQPFGSLNTTITFAGGVNTVGGSLVAHKVESSKLLTATDGTLTAAAAGGTAPTLSPVVGSAQRLGISAEPSANASAGAAFAQQPVIAVLDLYGNPTTGSAASITATPAVGTLFGTSPVNAANSVATFTGLSLTNAGTNTLTFSSSGLISTNSTVITNAAGAFVGIGWVTQPSGAVYRTVFGTEPVLAAVDQYGNQTTSGLSANIPVTVALTSGPGALSGTTNYNLGTSGSNGVVSFTDLTIDAVSNNFVLTATATLPASSTPPVAGMAVWLDASDTNSVIGSSPVTQWNDKSGNHYNFGVPAGSGIITYGTTNMNGKPVVSFPGGPALLTANNAYTFTGNSMTLFCVVRTLTYLAASEGPFDSAGAGDADGNSATWGMNANYPPTANFTVQGTTITGSGLPDGAAGPQIPFIWEGADNGPANQEWAGYFDGTTSNLVSNITGAQSAFAITQLVVGSRLSSVNNLTTPWQGDVAEVLLYHSYLSLSQQAQTYSYLQGKWLGGGGGGSSVSAATAPFTVSPAPITITGGITANNKAFDGTTNDTLTIGSVTFSGVFAPDNGNVNPNTSGAVGYFASAGPGMNIPVTVTGLTLTGGAASNYVVAPLLLSANITEGPAMETPTFSNLSSPSITYGTATKTLTGTLSAAGPVYPANGETVTATINGHGVNGTVTDGTGDFSITYNDPSLASDSVSGSPYPITYSYAGDASLTSTNDASTHLTVTTAALTVTLVSSENPSGYRDSVSFTGTVSPSVAGMLMFATNGVTFDTESLSGGSATSVATPALARGATPVTATYAGSGNYTGQTNLSQVVTNHPPALNPASYTRIQNLELAIKFSDLLTNASDADGDTLTLGYVTPSTNGTALTDDGTYLYYTNSSPPNVSDAFNYYVNDSFGGLTTNTVFLTVDTSQTGQPILTNYVAGGQSKVSFTALPNYIYYLQRSTNLTGAGTDWSYISTNIQSTNGLVQIIDTFQDLNLTTPPLPSPAFYRVLVP